MSKFILSLFAVTSLLACSQTASGQNYYYPQTHFHNVPHTQTHMDYVPHNGHIDAVPHTTTHFHEVPHTVLRPAYIQPSFVQPLSQPTFQPIYQPIQTVQPFQTNYVQPQFQYQSYPNYSTHLHAVPHTSTHIDLVPHGNHFDAVPHTTTHNHFVPHTVFDGYDDGHFDHDHDHD